VCGSACTRERFSEQVRERVSEGCSRRERERERKPAGEKRVRGEGEEIFQRVCARERVGRVHVCTIATAPYKKKKGRAKETGAGTQKRDMEGRREAETSRTKSGGGQSNRGPPRTNRPQTHQPPSICQDRLQKERETARVRERGRERESEKEIRTFEHNLHWLYALTRIQTQTHAQIQTET